MLVSGKLSPNKILFSGLQTATHMLGGFIVGIGSGVALGGGGGGRGLRLSPSMFSALLVAR